MMEDERRELPVKRRRLTDDELAEVKRMFNAFAPAEEQFRDVAETARVTAAELERVGNVFRDHLKWWQVAILEAWHTCDVIEDYLDALYRIDRDPVPALMPERSPRELEKFAKVSGIPADELRPFADLIADRRPLWKRAILEVLVTIDMIELLALEPFFRTFDRRLSATLGLELERGESC